MNRLSELKELLNDMKEQAGKLRDGQIIDFFEKLIDHVDSTKITEEL